MQISRILLAKIPILQVVSVYAELYRRGASKDMGKIEDSGDASRVSPAQQKLYQQEYKRGAELFEQALDQHAHSNSMYQKEEFREVMNRAMDVLNESARALRNEKLKQLNEQIEEDYKTYQDGQSPGSEAQLKNDLERAKKEIGS